MSRVVDKAVRLPITVKVTNRSGAYDTATVIGQRASSTSSGETAMERLVEKLHQRLQLPPGTLAATRAAAKGLKAGESMRRVDVADAVSLVCGGCAATLADRLQNKPEAPTKLTECPYCFADKCSMCDMGDDVECGSCELEH